MRFLAAVTALVAAVSAAPTSVLERGSCSIGSSAVTVGSGTQTLTGPFYLRVSQATSTTKTLNGNYATLGDYGNMSFGRKFKTNAVEFYLTKAGALVSVTNGVMSSTYQVLVGGFGHVQLGTKQGSNPGLKCTLSSSCSLTCTVSGGDDQCLSSPNFQPDWHIGTHKALSGCVPFVPLAVAV